MSKPALPGLLQRFYSNQNYQFWFCQFIGWAGLSFVTFLSLNLWYNQPQFSYLAHNVVQSVLGALVAWPLRGVFHHIWKMPFAERLTKACLAVLACSLSWSVLRLSVFMWMTGEQGVWADFGGWFFPSIFVFSCWSALYHGIKYYQLLQQEHAMLVQAAALNREEQLKRSQAESIAREAQLKMLRYQLNPHFLFNTLNAISSLVQSSQSERANRMIVQLSDFLRYSLDNDPEQMVPLAKEIDALRLYLKIEQTRFGDRLEVDFDIAPDVEAASVPSLLLQPLVENSIKYAIAPSEEGGRISIRAYLDARNPEQEDSEQLVIELTDTGSDLALNLDQPPSVDNKGVGLQNTRNRLKTLYGEDYGFAIEANEQAGVRVQLKMPSTDSGQRH